MKEMSQQHIWCTGCQHLYSLRACHSSLGVVTSWLPLKLEAARREPLLFQCCSWCMKPLQCGRAKEGLVQHTLCEILSYAFSRVTSGRYRSEMQIARPEHHMQGIEGTSSVSTQHT